MDERILYERTEPQPDATIIGRIHTGASGLREYSVNGDVVATEADGQVAKIARWIMEFQAPSSVAWIGGGFCIGPRIVKTVSAIGQDVYEIEPTLAEFCPPGVKFIPGDYRETIIGSYDVIVFDLGGEVPREFLTTFLAPGGVILPKE